MISLKQSFIVGPTLTRRKQLGSRGFTGSKTKPSASSKVWKSRWTKWRTLSTKALISGFTLCATLNATAKISTHDLNTLPNDSYQVSGPDPYFMFKIEGSSQAPSHLLLDLNLTAQPKNLQLFFKRLEQSFDPWHRLNVKNLELGKPIAIKIPANITLETGQDLRLDIEGCTGCNISFNGIARLTADINDATEVFVDEVFNGVTQMANAGLVLPNIGWLSNDTDGTIDNFQIAAIDPYWVSPAINLGTENIAAAYFKLRVPANSNISNDFQFFYATENHGFIERANALLRSPNHNQNSNNGQLELLFPLSHLSSGFPKDQILQKIRLDLPLIEGDWSILESRLISSSEFKNYQELMPPQLIQNKRQRMSKWKLMNGVFNNVFSDLGFILSYLALMLFVLVGFIRAYKK